MAMHECLFHIKFEILAKNLSEENSNKLIRRLRERLNKFKLEKDGVKASVDVPANIDFGGCSFVNDDLAVGYYRNISMHVIDNCLEGQAMERWNNVIKAQIANALKSLEEKRFNATLRIVEVDYH